MADKLVIPGQFLSETKTDSPENQARSQAGSGTFFFGNKIYASVLGVKQNNNQFITVESCIQKNVNIIPKIGDIVIVKVTKTSLRFAQVEILCVGEKILPESFPGKIRIQDVRAFEIDDVKIGNSYRPGDIVRAKVLSLGDKRSYYLSTAQNEFGVIIAHSYEGHQLIPISWCTMQCPETFRIEYRKVAKPT